MAAKKSTKSKRGKAPPLPVAGKTARRSRRPEKSQLSARVREILARTKTSRDLLDRACEGADMRSLSHLPVVHFPLGKPKLPGIKGKLSDD